MTRHLREEKSGSKTKGYLAQLKEKRDSLGQGNVIGLRPCGRKLEKARPKWSQGKEKLEGAINVAGAALVDKAGGPGVRGKGRRARQSPPLTNIIPIDRDVAGERGVPRVGKGGRGREWWQDVGISLMNFLDDLLRFRILAGEVRKKLLASLNPNGQQSTYYLPPLYVRRRGGKPLEEQVDLGNVIVTHPGRAAQHPIVIKFLGI